MPEHGLAGEAILIHGAWQGSWVWPSQIGPLSAAGWRCTALDLPGNGVDGWPLDRVTFADHISHARAALLACDGPAVLVAHSGAGVLATQLAQDHPDRVARIVYVCGMMLLSGVDFPEMITTFVAADPAAIGIGAYLEPVPGGSRVPEAAAMEIFYHDCPPEAARAAAARLTPQAEGVRAPRVTHSPDRFGLVPRAYIRCGADRSVVPAVQDAMLTALPGATLRRLDCGHAPMLAAPEALAAALLDLISANQPA
jgi:pimeloyl-ACP methyl ester carboxylesterase